MKKNPPFIHETAVVESGVSIGAGAKVWHFCHLRKDCVIGDNVSLGKGVFVDAGVRIEEGARVQNGVDIYTGVHIARWSFIGPHVSFTNDQFPRTGNRRWRVEKTWIDQGASLGAGAVIISGVRIGAYAMVGAGAVVTYSVPPFHLVTGMPAQIQKMVCACGQSRWPLGTPLLALIRPCCRKNLGAKLSGEAKKIARQRP